MTWEATLPILGYVGVGLLCLGGLVLSCVSLSGTWLVVLAAVLGAFVDKEGPPGLWTVVIFIAISGAIEGIEAMAGTWGVSRRGGSRLAGFMAFLGGFLGLFAGTLIPIPILGPLLGMIVVSFLLVFLVEKRRLKAAEPAAHIALGAVVARVLVILLKVGATLGMTAALVVMLWS